MLIKKYLLTMAVMLCLAVAIFNTAFCAENSPKIYIDGEEKAFASTPKLVNGIIYLPMRNVFEYTGCSVQWNNGKITAKNNQKTIVLYVGKNTAEINGKKVTINGIPFMYKDVVYVPLRFIGETLGKEVEWDSLANSVYVGGRPYVESGSRKITINGKTFNVRYVKADLNNKNIGLRVAVAQNSLGLTESLKSMAERNDAIAAINGTFFNAYSEIKEPAGNIIINGKIEHISDFGTTFGFTEDNKTGFTRLSLRLAGYTETQDGQIMEWVPYAVNRTPANNPDMITIYTPVRGKNTRFNNGISVIIENGIIKKHVQGQADIPADGFVVNLNGSETRYIERFPVGSRAYYKQEIIPEDGNTEFWENVSGAIGAGPRLLTNGEVTVNPAEEGFTSEKILSYSMARSAVGVTKDNQLILVTVDKATIKELALIMKDLDAYNAMNLDGGASSGLYYKGKYLTAPGRELSNALIIYKKK